MLDGRVLGASQVEQRALTQVPTQVPFVFTFLPRQAAEPPLSPGSLLYVLYVLYLTRQAAEHPLSPGSCYMWVLAICAICAISYTPSR